VSAAEDQARAELAVARQERREASHVIALQVVGALDPAPAGAVLWNTRREIELRVAEYRLQLWADELRRLESKLRGMGLRP
jgi:hypothetical protein